jgi:hypothetical protein
MSRHRQPYGRMADTDGHAAEREEIDTTPARRVVGSGGLVAEGGFEPPTKGL